MENFNMIIIGIVLTIVVAVVVYFIVSKNDKNTQPIQENLGNFLVSYSGNSLNSSEEIKNNYHNHVKEATDFWNDMLIENTKIKLTISTFSEQGNDFGIVLAKAGPYSIFDLKGGGNLYINLSAGSRNWTDVIKHEIGHVMGIGLNVYWTSSIINGSLDGRKFPISLQEYKDSYGGDENTTLIPLSSGRGHFSEEIFDRELMTPYSDAPDPQPVTKLTLGALKSMGWDVDLNKSELPH